MVHQLCQRQLRGTVDSALAMNLDGLALRIPQKAGQDGIEHWVPLEDVGLWIVLRLHIGLH
jgi:acyl-ACP thioesterase